MIRYVFPSESANCMVRRSTGVVADVVNEQVVL